MQQTLDHLWRTGQALEAKGDLARAQSSYQAILDREPRHIPARLRLSRFAQFNDDYRGARQHALTAADQIRSGASTRLLAFVTQRLLDFSEENEVAALILAMDWTDPEVLRQSPALAQHLWLAGRFHDALRFLDAVQSKVAENALLSFTRGNVLRYLGRAKDATAHYLRAQALQPHTVDVHWALATHGRQEGASERLGRIEASQSRYAADSLEQIHLLYALFHELDRLEQCDAAWKALRRGSELMHQRLKHNPALDKQRIRALQSLGCEPQGANAATYQSQPRPIFIVGLPRTGTTLLDRILGNHGWVSSAGERNDFAAAVSQATNHFFGTLMDEEDPAAFLDIDLKAVGHAYQQRLRQHASATAYAIDKNPQNLFNLPLIIRALPQAKILVLVRDPMDAAFSNLKELFQGGAYAYSYDFQSLAVRVSGVSRLIKGWSHQNPDAIRVISYETLVQAPEQTIAATLDFLGLPAATGLTDLSSNTSAVATASSSQVRDQINQKGRGAWLRYASQLGPLKAMMDNG